MLENNAKKILENDSNFISSFEKEIKNYDFDSVKAQQEVENDVNRIESEGDTVIRKKYLRKRKSSVKIFN